MGFFYFTIKYIGANNYCQKGVGDCAILEFSTEIDKKRYDKLSYLLEFFVVFLNTFFVCL